MISVRGIYENGQITLLEKISHTKKANVIVTILEEGVEVREDSPTLGKISVEDKVLWDNPILWDVQEPEHP